MKDYLISLATDSIDSVMNNGMSIGEKTELALQMVLLGLAIVFSVLIIIMLILLLFRYIFSSRNHTASVSKSDSKVSSVEQTVQAPVACQDEITLAVITAAIAAVYESETAEGRAVTGFRVVSFKPAGKVKPWTGV